MFYCPYCSMVIKQEKEVMGHLSTHYVIPKDCKICGMSFASKRGLMNHQVIHNPIPTNCDICGITFPSRNAMVGHRKWHDEGFRESFRQKQKFTGKKGVNLGPLNGQWKENASLVSIHEYIINRKPKPKCCERCHEEKRLDLSYNIHDAIEKGIPYSRNPSDYTWLCRRCHMTLDGRLEKMRKMFKEINRKRKVNGMKFDNKTDEEDYNRYADEIEEPIDLVKMAKDMGAE